MMRIRVEDVDGIDEREAKTVIFRKEPTAAPSSAPAPAAPLAERDTKPVQHSIISSDLHINGDIVSTGDIKIDGRVDGNITCRTLTLGSEPILNSKVTADTVRICGTFEGEIRAKSVVLEDTAKVKGNIYQETLEVRAGAQLEGSIQRLKASDTAGQTRSVSAGTSSASDSANSGPDNVHSLAS